MLHSLNMILLRLLIILRQPMLKFLKLLLMKLLLLMLGHKP